MPRIVNCPGSVNLCRQFPELSEDEGEEARQGTLTHWLSQQKLSHGQDPWTFLNKAPINDQIVDREMIFHVLNYCEIIGKIGNGQVEQRYEIAKGEFAGFGGTPDFIFHALSLRKLIVIDLKYGFIPVSPERNWQLLSYVWLFCKTYPKLQINSIEFGIYQPRITTKGDAYKSWEFSFQHLQKFNYFQKIEEALRACQISTSITRAGDHCHYCSAMLQCNSNLATCLRIVNLGGMQYGQEPTGEQLSNQLELFRFASKILKRRLQVVEAVAEHRLKSGEQLPRYCLKSSKGNRYWDISPERAKRIGIPNKPSVLMTPKQAGDNGFSQDLISKFTKTKTVTRLIKFDIQKVEELLHD